ncbi:MAG: sigma-70 family RNA polymerase sigma factor [Cyclobacteriaceae bacterium]|nr:sigma-70 family RNA polymerase sigma factor [Cyclobacteriaceae bacterium]
MSITLSEFEQLFDQYFESIKNFVYFKTGNTSVSEDIVQETFIKVWERSSEIKLETVSSLLYTIASNLAKNHLKHQNVVLNFVNKQTIHSYAQTPQQVLEEQEFGKKLEEALGGLSEAHRTTFLMNRIDQITYSEIAKRLDISVKTVEKRMSIALKQLYQALGHKL